MTPQLEISTQGALGLITLNRPEAINALSREMIDGITETLTAWRDDPDIGLILFEGRGSRGFCSGGDVRAVRQLVLDGQFAEADAYFAAEYGMNGLISTFPKPLAAIGHGVVMGGGIGIFGHCRYRFAPPGSRFAMPEAAIGFVSDIGVNALLAEVPEARALAFLLVGLPVGTGDALTLGLCDAAIDPARLEALHGGLVAAAEADDVDSAVVRTMEAESIEPSAAVFCAQADVLGDAFAAPSAAEIAAAVATRATAEPAFEPLSKALALRSPTSLEAIVVSHRAARHDPDIDAVLALDLRLARFMIRQPDFAEGVRAVLVDKDQAPRWQPRDFAGIDAAGLSASTLTT
jgi:enoyl-CoA hydratase